MLRKKLQLFSFFLLFLFSVAYSLQLTAYSSYAEDSKEEESLFVAKKAFEDGFYEVSLGLLERFQKSYPQSDKSAEVDLLIGQCYFNQNRYLEALNKFEALLGQPQAKNIRDAVLYWIAEVHFKGNNFGKAANFYKAVIDSYPASSYISSAYYSLGWCLFQEHKFQEALKYFQVVEEKYSKEPQAKDAPFKVIECLYNLKDYAALKEKVKPYLKIYAKDHSRLSYLYFYLAEADYYLNNFNDALDEYSKAAGSTADEKMRALAGLGTGWTYLKLKRYPEAQEAFQAIKSENLEKRSADVLLLGRAVLMAETARANEAKNIYDQLIAETGDPAVLIQAYIGKADALSDLADYNEAVNVYKEALNKIDNGFAGPDTIDKLHYDLAWAYLKQGEFKEAIREFQKIAKSSSDNIVRLSALCQIGDAYQDSGDYRKAQETYDTILKDYPDSSYGDYVQYQLGIVLLKNSNYEGAIMSFLNLKKNFPNSKLLDDASYALGLAYFQRQDYNLSRETFQRFEQEFKDSNLKSQALYLLGSSLYNMGKFKEAIDVFKDIIRIYGQDIELVQKAEYEIADCFYQMGDEKEAMNRFRSLRAKYPDSTLTAEIIWWLGEYYYRHNDLNFARRYFSSLISDFPNSNLVADAHYALGISYMDEGNYQEALNNLNKVINLGKSDLAGQAASAVADIYVKQDNPEAALKAYKGILNNYPNLANLVYPKVADLFYKISEYSESLEYYRKSLDIIPVKEMPDIQFKIGEVMEAQGKSEAAIEEYLKVTYLYTENTQLSTKALLRVAAIYEGKNDFKEAINIYKRIIAMNVQEAKYAQERLDWIKAHIRIGGG